jgi:hypothetical protein
MHVYRLILGVLIGAGVIAGLGWLIFSGIRVAGEGMSQFYVPFIVPLSSILTFQPENAALIFSLIVPWLACGVIVVFACGADRPKEGLKASILFMACLIGGGIVVYFINPSLLDSIVPSAAGMSYIPAVILAVLEGGGLATAMAIFITILREPQRS